MKPSYQIKQGQQNNAAPILRNQLKITVHIQGILKNKTNSQNMSQQSFILSIVHYLGRPESTKEQSAQL